MEAAVQAVKDGIDVNKAVTIHGIPKSTLKDRIHGRVAPGSKLGPKPYLTNQEEKQLSHYLLEVPGHNIFELYMKVLDENGLMDKPAQLYNMDDTDMPLEHRAPSTIAKNRRMKV